MPRVRITNNTPAPQGFYATDLDGPMLPGSIDGDFSAVQIAPGQSRRLQINDQQLVLAKMHPGLAFEVLADDAAHGGDAETQVEARADDGTRNRGDQNANTALQPPAGRDNTAAAVAAAAAQQQTADKFEAMDDDALRAYITDRDGKAPHHMLGRPKLLAQARGETGESF